ncbi:hypothetical protein SAMN02983006_02060 [Halanaerobium salsuginis]|uniref:Uncharacterized protein n=2 Tax=Halanaerobium salsuginis TaxID=29563 RepID=A0A1I4KNJ5_9FIRM|nr:hypothetical protein SAMN02983006_02060 [Halanaerobium salsuginis]
MRSWKVGIMLRIKLRGLSVRADGLFFYLEVKIMPVNGVPSDDWRIKRALGPYAEPMDEDELERSARLLQKKKNSATALSSNDQEFKMPF